MWRCFSRYLNLTSVSKAHTPLGNLSLVLTDISYQSSYIALHFLLFTVPFSATEQQNVNPHHHIVFHSTLLFLIRTRHSTPFFFVYAVSTLSLAPTHNPHVESIYRAVAELSANNSMVRLHFIRVELKDIIGKVKTTVDEKVIDLLLM